MPWLADNPDSYKLLHLWRSVHVLTGDEKLFDGQGLPVIICAPNQGLRS